jgi:hypothetical protein
MGCRRAEGSKSEGSKNDDGGKDEELLTPVVVQSSFGWHVVLR